MTRDEILALEPGPKLDALVAERVMGWSQYQSAPYGAKPLPNPYPHWDYSYDYRQYEVLVYRVAPEKGPGAGDPWHPSSDANQALEVADKAFPQGYVLAVNGIALTRRYRVKSGFDSYPSSDLAGQAICRAALLTTLENPNDNQPQMDQSSRTRPAIRP